MKLDSYRAQCYDGPNNMLGKLPGLAVQIQALQSREYYTYCHAHLLSLSVEDVTKTINILKDTMRTAGKIIILIKYSSKRENLLEKLKDQVECNCKEAVNAYVLEEYLTIMTH